MVNCIECENFKACHNRGELTGVLTSCTEFLRKPITNADRIRSMSDEELAEFINDGTVCDRCSFLGACVNPYSPERCKEGVLNWLRQPVTQPCPGADDNHDHSGLLEE